MTYVYVLQSLIDNKFYVGMTDNIERRIKQHNSGMVRSTKSHVPFRLVYKDSFENRSDARRMEKYYKSGFGREQLKTTFL